MKRKNVKAMVGVVATTLAVGLFARVGLTPLAAFETQEEHQVSAAQVSTAAAGDGAVQITDAGIAKFIGNIKNDQNTKTAAAAVLSVAAEASAEPAEIMKAQQEEQQNKELLDRQQKIAEWEGRAIASNVEEYVYIRESASADSAIVGKLPRGGAGDVIEQGESFTHISSGYVEGYVSNDYLAFGEEALEVAEAVCETVAVAEGDNISIRQQPSDDAEILQTVQTGESFEVLEEQSDWVTVQSGDVVGYMSKAVVDVKLLTKAAEEVVTATPEPEPTEEVKEEPAADTGSSKSESSSASQSSSSKSSSSSSESSASSSSSKQESSASESKSVSASAGGSNSATFKVTAYCSCAKCCGSYANGITATGTKVTAGRTIAVDSSVIPLGTTVYINGQAYVAEDTGVKGNTIDIYMSSHSAALSWGVQYLTVTW